MAIDIKKFGKGGLIKDRDLRDYRLEVIPTAIVLPKKYSIKNRIGKIKHQNGSGSCVSQATSYYTEALNNIETGKVVAHSPRFLYSSVYVEPQGSYVKDNMSMVCNSGIAEEKDVPSYDNSNPPSEQFMRKKDDITQAIKDEAMTYWARKYVTWDNQNIDMYKRAIIEGNGCVLVSWGNNYLWQNGDIQLPDYPSQMEWMHGVYVFGYDDDKQAFEFVNSWGSEWGYTGFGWLPYEYATRGFLGNPTTLIDLPNQQYSLMMKIIGLLKNIIAILTGK